MNDPEAPADNRPDVAELQARVEQLETALAALTRDLNAVREHLAGTSRPQVVPASLPSVEPPPPPRPAIHPAERAPLFPPPFLSAGRTQAGTHRSALDRAGSLETRLGDRVLSKVAVVLLLVGASWFLKWAFENRWVGPTGRVLTGLFAGAAVVVWSERFRRQGMDAFSYALKAVGTGVLYLSLWAAFQLYHLVPAPVALLAMVGVTAANATLALAQNSPLLAAYALLGAYLTPGLLSTGGDHEVFIFSYLLAVALSVTVLLRQRPWHLLLCGALPATVMYYIAWYVAHFRAGERAVTLLFTLLLWAAFSAVPLVARQARGSIVAVFTPLGAAAFGALAVYSVLVDSSARPWEPWASLLFAAAYLLLTRLRRGGLVEAMHLSLAIVFLTITIPLKVTGRGITAGWLAEAVVLLWVATLPKVDPSARKALRLLGCGSLLLGVAGALFSPLLLRAPGNSAFLNRDFALSMGALAALAAAALLSLRAERDQAHGGFGHAVAASALVLGNVVLLVAVGRALHRLYLSVPTTGWVSAREHADFAFSAWLTIQGILNLAAGFARRVALARWLGLLLLGVTLLKVFAYDMRSLGTGYYILSYLGLGDVLMAVSFAYQKDWMSLREAVAGGEQASAPAAQEAQG